MGRSEKTASSVEHSLVSVGLPDETPRRRRHRHRCRTLQNTHPTRDEGVQIMKAVMKAVLESEESATNPEKAGCLLEMGPSSTSGADSTDTPQSARTRDLALSRHAPQTHSIRTRRRRAISDSRNQLVTCSEDNLTKLSRSPRQLADSGVPGELPPLARSASVPAGKGSPTRSMNPIYAWTQQQQIASYNVTPAADEVVVGLDQRAELIRETSQLFNLEGEVVEALLDAWYSETEERFDVSAAFGWLLDHGGLASGSWWVGSLPLYGSLRIRPSMNIAISACAYTFHVLTTALCSVL